MASLALALMLALSPMTAADSVPTNPERRCSRQWPATIVVFRRHARGSDVPARVQVVDFDTYVGRVLQSGAMPPDRPMEALRAMVAAVATRSTWLVCHPDRRMRWHGRQFAVTDGSLPAWCQSCDHGQFYQAVKVHSRIRQAIRDVRGTLLRRPDGTLRKAAWSGTPSKCGTGVLGNRLPAQGAASCARRGYGWLRILSVYFPKGEVVR